MSASIMTPLHVETTQQQQQPAAASDIKMTSTTAATTQIAPASAASTKAEDQKYQQDTESGYVSATETTSSSPSASVASLPRIALTQPHLDHINAQLEGLPALDILRFAKLMFPNLYQSTAFGLTGLVTLDMLSKLQAENPAGAPVDLIFLDTLYHFEETHDLVGRIRARYPNVALHVYRPDGTDTTAAFEALYGEKLWEVASEMYDWLAKVEPLQRAYDDLKVAALLTGRRRSQGGARDKMPIVEVDAETGVIKINPLASWTFEQVRGYIREHDVPYNALLDRGYKSVGDWHSTVPVGEGEDERAGRWKGQKKSECGIHNKKSRYAQFLAKQGGEKKPKLDEASKALEKVGEEQQQQQQQKEEDVVVEAPAVVEQKTTVVEQVTA